MSLEEAVNAAYETAQISTDPADWATYHALSAALHAERNPPPPLAPAEDIPDPPIKEVRIFKPGIEN
jgi:hypothetical protein